MDLQQFGSTIKQKYPQYGKYSDEEIGKRMLEKYPQYKDRVSDKPKEGILSTGSNILRKLGLGIIPAAASGVANIPNLLNAGNPEEYKKGLKKNPFMDQEVINQLEKGDTTKFRERAYEDNPTTAMNNILGLVSGGGVGKAGARAVAHPIETVGRQIEKKVVDAGRVPDGLLEKYFGTYSRPNEEIISRIGTARDKGKLSQKLRAEILTQGRGAGGVVENPTYSKIHDLRIGAGRAGKFGSNASGDDILLNRELQKVYSAILKEGAGTEKLDKLFSTLKGIESKKKLIGAAGSGVLIYALLNKLVDKIAPQN